MNNFFNKLFGVGSENTGPFTKIDRENKVSETDKYIFFLNGPLSQWYPASFKQRLSFGGELLTFNCAEQYMMASKAFVFGDEDTLAQIMAIQQGDDWRAAPKAQKALGRQVKNFDSARWDKISYEVVRRGNWAKFNQTECGNYLMATGAKTLVEGAHYDTIWGVGLAWDNPEIIDRSNWRGENRLGQALMDVRYMIDAYDSMQAQSPYTTFDEWSWRLT